mgnify:FL=1
MFFWPWNISWNISVFYVFFLNFLKYLKTHIFVKCKVWITKKKSPKQSTIITFECRNNILLNYVLLYLRMLNLFSTNDTQYYYENSITAENLENRLPLCSLFTTMVDRFTPPHFVLLYKYLQHNCCNILIFIGCHLLPFT